MRGRDTLTGLADGRGRFRPSWRPVADVMAAIGPVEFAARAAALNRRLEFEMPGHGIGAARLDPIPVPLTRSEFVPLAAALAARAAALAAILDDLNGARHHLADGALPGAALFSSPGFIRPLAIPADLAAPRLTFYTADLVRQPDGGFRIIADHVDTPPGLGLALAIRRLTAEVVPELFGAVTLASQRPLVETLQDMLHELARGGPIGLLATDGADPGDAVLLARQIGGLLLRPDDLSCEGDHLALRTLQEAAPLRLLIRLGRAGGIDPLEQGGPPAGGIPGLFHCLRAGTAAMLNAPGSALLDDPALAEPIEMLIGTTHPTALRRAAAGIEADDRAPCAALPGVASTPSGFASGRITLRLHAARIAGSWQVLPGGLAQVAPADGTTLLKDVWIIEDGHADPPPSGPTRRFAAPPAPRPMHALPARLAEDLLWLGRMTERLDAVARLLGLALPRFANASALPHEVAQRKLLARSLVTAGLLDEEEAGPFLSVRTLREALGRKPPVTLLCREIRRLLDACAGRFSTAMRSLIEDAFDGLAALPSGEAPALSACRRFVATFNGVIAEHAARGGAFIFVEIGRRLERAEAMAETLAILLGGPADRLDPGLSLGIELADAAQTYESIHAAPVTPAPALALLLADPDYPRSLAFQTEALAVTLTRLGAAEAAIARTLTARLGSIAAAGTAPGAALAALVNEIQGLSARFDARCFVPVPPPHHVGVEE